VLDGVHVVWVGLLEESLEVVHQWPRLALQTMHSSDDTLHAGAINFLVVVIVIVDHDRNSLRALFTPLLAALGAPLGILDGIDGWHCVVATWSRLLAAWDIEKFGRLLSGGVLGGDAAQLLGGVVVCDNDLE
jgi:hypothetical protein